MAGGVIEQQQDLLARYLAPPPCGPGLHAGRDLLGGQPGGQQQASQCIGRLNRPLAGGVGVQRQEKLPIGETRSELVCGVHREGGLADPGHPVDRADPHHPAAPGKAVNPVQQLSELSLAAGEVS